MVSIPTVSLLGSAENFVMTRGASSVAPEIDWLMYFILWVCVIFGTLIFVGTAWLAWRYRHKPGVNDIGHGPTHSNLLEIVWSVIPLIIVMLIAIWGFQGYMDLAVLPPNNDADTIEINVTAFKWGWSFEYPNGHSEPTLHVPVNTKIRLVLTSQDVIGRHPQPVFPAVPREKGRRPGPVQQVLVRSHRNQPDQGRAQPLRSQQL